MDIRLYHKEPSWEAACWAVMDGTEVLHAGLTVVEAMRSANVLNTHSLKWGLPQTASVKFVGYPETPIKME